MHLLEFAEQLGVGLTGFNREFNRMIGGIEAAAATLYAQFEARTDVPPALRPAQMHMPRCIQHLPISTMVRQLQ